MLKHRLIFGPLMILGALLMFWADGYINTLPIDGGLRDLLGGQPHMPGGVALLVVGVLIIPLAARELAGVLEALGVHTRTWLLAMSAIACAVTVYATPVTVDGPTGGAILASVLLACFVITLLWHSRGGEIPGVVTAAGGTLLGAAYLGLTLGFYLAMRHHHAPSAVLAVILITKCGDIGAYFTGRAIGRHKLIPWLSPGKTWEGLLGGIALATVAAIGFAMLSQSTDVASVIVTVDGQPELMAVRYHPWKAALAGVLLAVVGAGGDLVMSLFKRDSGLKDSGNTIPGFGGLLDVLDSPLMVAPIGYWMLDLAAG